MENELMKIFSLKKMKDGGYLENPGVDVKTLKWKLRKENRKELKGFGWLRIIQVAGSR